MSNEAGGKPPASRFFSSRAIAWVCLAVVAAIAWWNFDRNPSPGPLHPTHAAVVDLDGNAGCAKCHTDDRFDGTESFADACNACHARIADQLVRHSGIHGTLDAARADNCAECHHEHVGDTIKLVSLSAFERAGIPAPELYDHSHAGGLALSGKHLELECAKCHVFAQNGLIPAGQARFLGLSQQCTGCHNDVHKGELGNDCAKCHGQEQPFKAVPMFSHPASFPLVEGHARRKCSDCHLKMANPPTEDVTEGAVLLEYKGLSTNCASCHTDDYDKTSRPAHKVASLGTDCAKCHGVAKWTPARFDHDADFALTGAHAKPACADCHSAGARQQEVAAFGVARTKRNGQECAACHRDEYDKTTNPAHAVARIGLDCATCHGVDDWKKANYAHDPRFALVGAHQPLACSACHSAGIKQQQVQAFDKSRSCAACHANPHDARLIAAADRVRGARPDSCVVCHKADTRDWREADAAMTPDLHAATGFALVAPHHTQQCSACHAGIAPKSAGRAVVVTAELRTPAQWKADFPGRTQDGCESCHKDPHGGQFKKSGKANNAASDCIDCHLPATFAPTKYDLTMHADCAFPLDGSHRAVACASCHKVVDGVRRFVGTKTACVDCHEDVHKGAFDGPGKPAVIGGKSDCARCHTTERFAKIVWTGADHATWTGESLLGKHATASCNDCHRRDKPRGRTLAPFRPAPKECVACHEDVHAGQFAPDAGAVGAKNPSTDCARCHASFDAFTTVTFDHQKDSRFPLDDDHGKLACAACHKPVDVAGRAVVRYKPLGVQCADCHDPRVIRPRPRASGGSAAGGGDL